MGYESGIVVGYEGGFVVGYEGDIVGSRVRFDGFVTGILVKLKFCKRRFIS